MPVGQNSGPSGGMQMVATSSTSKECHCHHLSCVPLRTGQAFFIARFRHWGKQLQLHARTSARCIMGTVYQSHHALQALNTATVFWSFVSLSLPPPSLLFPEVFLTSFPPSGQLLCWCSCLFIMPVRKSGRGWEWWEEQVRRLSDTFSLNQAQCTSVRENNPIWRRVHRVDRQYT